MASYLTAEISAGAVAHNLDLLRALLPRATRLCAVVKADAYGHGLDLVLGTITRHSDGLAVATPQEAIELRQKGYRGWLLAFFSPCAYGDPHELAEVLEALIAAGVTLTVAAEGDVPLLSAAARRAGAAAEVHLKIDTGMGRSGVPADGAGAAVRQIRSERDIRLTGLYTHFACADEPDKASALEQFARFMSAAQSCGGRGGPPCLTLHCANSAAVIDLPQTHLDMVRAGIALYGYQPSDRMRNRPPLRPILRLTGKLMQVKTLRAGARCGYGLTHTFNRDSRVGLIPIGYADGYFRCLSDRAVMRAGGRDVPVVGRVSMDQTIIDLTDAPLAKVGDDVEIISADPAAPNSAQALSRLAGTIPYELTCRLGQRIRRVLVQ